MRVKDIMQQIEHLAPTMLKEDWDNVGLQIGDPAAEVKRVLLALTPSLTVVEEAIEKHADLIVTHHPFIFKGVKTLRTDTAIGRMSQLCLKHDVALYAAHTNLDIARGGVNDVLAERLGLVDVEGLEETLATPRYKVVVFVPISHLETVKTALFEAGAGWQGNYDACAWSVAGQGQFRPLQGADPYLGQVGAVEEVAEARLEVLVDHAVLAKVLTALRQSHPYEEPAYDVFVNEASVERESLGRIGRLPQPKAFVEWLDDVKSSLNLPVISFAGPTNTQVERVALCGGSATEFLHRAKQLGADVYVTGDMKYHDAQQAVELGLPMVDVSHYAGERPVLARLSSYLTESFGDMLDVIISENEENFIQYR
ncbi:MAG: Nif3-like dinuclear metal center hexameric protein [Peptococcaceae bacterium]|nr:Nif3-like dinuclear metal center hexameric protein [Peptococcaceae bacterium]